MGKCQGENLRANGILMPAAADLPFSSWLAQRSFEADQPDDETYTLDFSSLMVPARATEGPKTLDEFVAAHNRSEPADRHIEMGPGAGTVDIPRKILKHFFSLLARRLRTHLQDKLNPPPWDNSPFNLTFVLTGGGACNSFIREELTRWIRMAFGADTHVEAPRDPEVTVTYGAVVSALSGFTQIRSGCVQV